MGSICGQTLGQRQAQGVDLGTFVASHPSEDEIMVWARAVLDMSRKNE